MYSNYYELQPLKCYIYQVINGQSYLLKLRRNKDHRHEITVYGLTENQSLTGTARTTTSIWKYVYSYNEVNAQNEQL